MLALQAYISHVRIAATKTQADTRNLRILHVICIGCIISNQSICSGHHAEQIKSNIDCHSKVKVLIIPIGYNNMEFPLDIIPAKV